jgi:hypothetical protein
MVIPVSVGMEVVVPRHVVIVVMMTIILTWVIIPMAGVVPHVPASPLAMIV